MTGGSTVERMGGRTLARNSILNLLGWGLPLVAAIATVPLLVRSLGDERFGILTVGWVVIGYFGLFDFGLGRALTKLVAERLARNDREGVAALIWTAITLIFLCGVLGSVLLASLAPFLVHGVLKISPGLEGEAARVLALLAFSLPWVISTAGFIGVLEASQSFALLNALRVPMGLFNYIGPLLVLPFSHDLVPIVAVLVAGRVIGWAAYLVACRRVLPVLRGRPKLDWSKAAELARFGGWMTVSNVVSPLMTHLDRFLIGALISMAAVAYYTTPYELITRLWLVPSALLGVFFPAFAASFVHDRDRTALLFDRCVRALFLAVFPLVLIAVTFAREGMSLWLGDEFALHSTAVLKWLALGVFINCLGQVPFSLIQSVGRPDITGKLHLVEIPFYALAIWVLSRRFGLEGVAMAWVLRVVVDTSTLFAIAARFLPTPGAFRRIMGRLLTAAAVLALASRQYGGAEKFLLLIVVLAAFGLYGWVRLLTPQERDFLRFGLARGLRPRAGSIMDARDGAETADEPI